jgi:hypothetical protein
VLLEIWKMCAKYKVSGGVYLQWKLQHY